MRSFIILAFIAPLMLVSGAAYAECRHSDPYSHNWSSATDSEADSTSREES